MASYFSGYWGGNSLKPFISKGELSESVRYVQEQPLSFDNIYNYRKLIELPYHQAQSGLIWQLDNSLFNFNFIQAKCSSGLTFSLLSDYEHAIRIVANIDKIVANRLVEFAKFVRQNAGLLVANPYPSQLAVFQTGYPAQVALEQWDRKQPLIIWKNKGVLLENPIQKTMSHETRVTAAIINKNKNKIASADANYDIFIWDYDSSKLISTLKGHKDKVVQLQFLSDDKTLLSFSIDRTLIVWNTESKNIVSQISGYYNPRWSSMLDSLFKFVVSGDEKFAASGYGNIVEVWNIQQGKEIAKFQVAFRGNDNSEVHVEFLPGDSNKLVTANYDDDSCYSDLILWDIQTESKLKSTRLQFCEMVIWSKLRDDGKSLLFATGDNNFYSWENFDQIIAAKETSEYKQWRDGSNQANRSEEFTLEVKENILSVIDTRIQAKNAKELSSTGDYRVTKVLFNRTGKAALLCSDSLLRILYTKTGLYSSHIPVDLNNVHPAYAFTESDQLRELRIEKQIVTIRTWASSFKEVVSTVTSTLSSNGVVDNVKLSSTGIFGVVAVRTETNFEIKMFSGDVAKPLKIFNAPNNEYILDFSQDDKSLAYVNGNEIIVYETTKFNEVMKIKLDAKVSVNYGFSNDFSKFLYFNNGIVIVNLKDGSKVVLQSQIYTGDIAFSSSGNYLINSLFDNRGINIINTSTGAIVQHATFDVGVDKLFVAGNQGLCVDRQGTLYFLSLDF